MSAISVPRGHVWNFYDPESNGYKYMYHKSAGNGQTVFVVERDGLPWKDHTVCFSVLFRHAILPKP